jgi:hypothetical protein
MRWLLCLALLSAVSPTPAPKAQLELPPALQQFLVRGQWDAGTPRSFRIITLSHLADACAAQGRAHPSLQAEALRCVDRALALAKGTRAGAPLDSGDGLWLAHYGLILGARDALGPCAEPALHRALAQKLAQGSLADAHGIFASYATLPDRWPADQAATLAAIARYDGAHDAHLHEAPLQKFEAQLTLEPTTKLPRSELNGLRRTSKEPRGCAQSFISRYLAEVDPALSHTWWLQYTAHFLVRPAGLVGFREYRPGRSYPADDDSGPIVAGVGVAASAFAIAAARAQGDSVLAAELETSADLVAATGLGQGAERSLLALAVRAEAKQQPRLVP